MTLLFIMSLLLAGEIPFAASEPDSIPPDSTDMRPLSAVEIAREMIPGWNVGNSLEAIGSETAWGNPLIDQQLIDSVKAAGFKAIRIPVAWSRFSDAESFEIKEEWLDRVEEVVWYVLSSGLYAIINEHWDGGWQQPTYADSAYVNERLAAMWKQIAIRFRDYNDHLLFAGTNEIMKEGDWGRPKKEYYTVHNSFNQTFISTVRATGGRNAYRLLVIQGFNTNIDHTVNYLKIPADPTADRMLIEVHYYDPYNFTINENSSLYVWGLEATGSESWANEPWADSQFSKMKQKFINQGFGVLCGEYSAMARLSLSQSDRETHAFYRSYWTEYITYAAAKAGVVPFYWDNGYTGDKGCGVFNRHSGEQVFPDIIAAIMKGVGQSATEIDDSPTDKIFLPGSFNLEQNYPNPFNPNTSIGYQLSLAQEVSLTIFDLQGREIAVLEKNNFKTAGHYQIEFDATGLASGLYFYCLTAGEVVRTQKMLILK